MIAADIFRSYFLYLGMHRYVELHLDSCSSSCHHFGKFSPVFIIVHNKFISAVVLHMHPLQMLLCIYQDRQVASSCDCRMEEGISKYNDAFGICNTYMH